MFDEAMPVSETTQPTPEPEEKKAVNVVVTSKLKAVIKEKGLRMDGNLADAVNAKIIAMIEQAAENAKADGRATVRPFDLAA